MLKNIANILTIARILLIPIFVVVFYLPFQWCPMGAASIFALAAVTDWLDGYFARTLNQVSPLGTFLDPVADKLMVAVALILLVGDPHLHYITIPAAIIVGREIAISALREWMAEMGGRASLAVSLVGKIKTIVQMVALIILLAAPNDEVNILLIAGYIALYASAILTIWSMVMYLMAAWPNLMQETNS